MVLTNKGMMMVCSNTKCKKEYLTMEQDRDYNKAIREVDVGG